MINKILASFWNVLLQVTSSSPCEDITSPKGPPLAFSLAQCEKCGQTLGNSSFIPVLVLPEQACAGIIVSILDFSVLNRDSFCLLRGKYFIVPISFVLLVLVLKNQLDLWKHLKKTNRQIHIICFLFTLRAFRWSKTLYFHHKSTWGN